MLLRPLLGSVLRKGPTSALLGSSSVLLRSSSSPMIFRTCSTTVGTTQKIHAPLHPLADKEIASAPIDVTAPPATMVAPPSLYDEPIPLQAFQQARVASELPLESIVKVFSVQTAPNYFLPWQMKSQRESTGSGFLISKRRILTNAHVIAHQTTIMVRRQGLATKYPARCIAVGHECDIAVLTVDDDAFWEGVVPLKFGSIPQLQDDVTVVGYPTGGDNISVTGGVVSRIELQQYAHGDASLPAVQIDAAINPGNSGGPVLKDGKVVGIAFQHLLGAEAMGFIIPIPVIKRFLKDIEKHGKYTGFGTIGVFCQQTEAITLHKFFNMPPNMTGVLISRINKLSKANGILQKDDIMLKIDDHPIANDGTIVFRNRERILFNYLLSQKFVGDTVKVTILRDSKVMDVEVPISINKLLVPVHQFEKFPSYFVHAGLVFIPLVQPYLHEWEDWYNNSPRKLCDKALNEMPEAVGQQIVVLSHVLLHKINYGYQNLTNSQVLSFNGTKIHNLAQLVQLVESNEKPHLRFDLEDGMVVIIDAKEAAEATPNILTTHRIHHSKSSDLRGEEPTEDEQLRETKKNENSSSEDTKTVEEDDDFEEETVPNQVFTRKE